ncbi:MAG TPA: S8 family serine peptidase [Flavitalea sp.]|nr:S8 family serine peptidase [Flavitalea sp.]
MSQLLKATAFALLLGLVAGGANAQQDKRSVQSDLPKGWHLLDNTKDGYSGISLERAYEFIHSKNLKGKTVVVAVIDSGIDTLHEDLKEVLWRNPKEIPGNGVDDDKNGYVDDIYGWNFLGGKDGRNVQSDSYEGARVYHKYKAKFADVDPSTLSGEELDLYNMWVKSKKKIEGQNASPGVDLATLRRIYINTALQDSVLKKDMGKDSYTGNDLDNYLPVSEEAKKAKRSVLYAMKTFQVMELTNKQFLEDFNSELTSEETKAEAKIKPPKDYRAEIVKDNEEDINDKYYGNPDVTASSPFHGTHVSGIIAAVRKNNKGIDGIADNVKIMMIRAVPDGDEHDKDIALAIRYAVDNGARVVNMSFGKDFSPEKQWVDDAVKYAEAKGVLLVHAAGNDAKNIDTTDNFPNPTLKDAKRKATNWITVGASGDEKAGGLTASFSNYGKQEVDVFAPGVRIYSTVPGGNTYATAQGTSMASPVVAGTAAFLFSYFPYLTPQQVKYCIEKSAVLPASKVRKPGTDISVELSSISKSGGLLNAYEAAKLASTLSPENKNSNQNVPPKSVLKNKKD